MSKDDRVQSGPVNRVWLILLGCVLVLMACSNSSIKDGTSTTSTLSTAPGVPTGPTTSVPGATSPPAPTDCREAPQLPACREGHEERSSSSR
jgi:hypothetical protein